ncbi:MAG: hypothetical protein CVV32_10205 [Methanomicrobiales archaeon HGW-Methanomicrobiales-3]|jgi:putative endopeptidase|nr:MAG: hypothetical protein CVV32_10205 [Methanomicrobiales archaeon HGW-Methanomicrobiales-3]
MELSALLTKKILAIIAIILCLVAVFVILYPANSTRPTESHQYIQNEISQVELVPEMRNIDTSTMDTTVQPGRDLYRFANGKWLDAHQFSKPEENDGESMESQVIFTNMTIRIMEKLEEKNAAGTLSENERKMYAFYLSGLKAEHWPAKNLSPIQFLLDDICRIKTKEDVQEVSVELTKYGIKPFFAFYADSDRQVPYFYTGYLALQGPGMPREFFYEKNENTREFESHYKSFIRFCLMEAGYPEDGLNEKVNAVYSISKSLKEKTKGKARKFTLSELQEKQAQKYPEPVFDWEKFPEQIGNREITTITVYDDQEIPVIESVLAKSSVEDLKAYMTFRTMSYYSAYAGGDYSAENFNHFSEIKGQIEREPWKNSVIQAEKVALADIVAEEFNDEYVSDEAIADAKYIGSRIREVIIAKVTNKSGLSEDGRREIIEKIQSMSINIARPEQYLDYSALTVDDSSYMTNILNSNYFHFYHGIMGIEKIGEFVDRQIWPVNSLSNSWHVYRANAVYISPLALQSPKYSVNADPAIKYAVLGRLIGHEIGHGLDYDGIYYNSDGLKPRCITESDYTVFKTDYEKFIRQYAIYEENNPLSVSTATAKDEIISDVYGFEAAYEAYKTAEPVSFASKDSTGYTGAQRFFIAYAQGMRESPVNEYNYYIRVLNPKYPTSACRVNGSLSSYGYMNFSSLS